MKQGLIICLAGPTGSGESTITKLLIKKLPKAVRVITTTSRPKRLKEKDGVDYNFLTKNEFKKQIDQGKFLEYTYIENRDAYYGTKKQDFDHLLQNHNYIFFNCDIVGVKAIRQHYPKNNVSIFIMYQSINEIKNRLLTRQPNMPVSELDKRLEHAELEAQDKNHYDHIIINKENRLDETVKTARKIIKQAKLDKNP